jgi:hypothetical protein
MKKILLSVLLVVLVCSLSACAKPAKEEQRVKCPACGYEFVVPETP